MGFFFVFPIVFPIHCPTYILVYLTSVFSSRTGHMAMVPMRAFVILPLLFLVDSLKVSKSRKQIMKSRILPKNEQNTLRILF